MHIKRDGTCHFKRGLHPVSAVALVRSAAGG